MKYYLAIDIGASSGRLIVGYLLSKQEIATIETYRFSNFCDGSGDTLTWDIERIFNEILTGLTKTFAMFPKIESLAIDTWGVDYALLNGDQLITPVYAYRSNRTLAAIVIHYFLTKTAPGFKLRAVGDNKTAAASGGIKVKWYMLLAMGLSGGLAGLAGTTEVLGTYHRFIEGFSPSFGFTGIAVAILARNNPFAVILSALLFAILDTGSLRMARTTNISSNVVVVIQSLIIIAVSAPEMIKFVKKRKKVAKEEKEVIENDK